MPTPTPSTGTRRSRRRQVLDALARHRLAERAAQALYNLGLALRRRMLQEPDPALRVEYAGMVDARPVGQRIGPVVRGVRNGVDIAVLVWSSRGRPSAIVHTHPHSSSFSPDDADVLAKAPDVRAVCAVGADGTWYVLSRPPGAPAAAKAAVDRAYWTARHALAPKYRALVQAQAVSRARAWQDHSHEIWQQIAPALGLRYDRVVGKQQP